MSEVTVGDDDPSSKPSKSPLPIGDGAGVDLAFGVNKLKRLPLALVGVAERPLPGEKLLTGEGKATVSAVLELTSSSLEMC